MTLTQEFAQNLYATGRMKYDESILLNAKQSLLDYVGAALAGASMLRKQGKPQVSSLVGDGTESSVIGMGRRATLLDAALANGMSSHIAELDDGVRQGSVHPGAPIFSALLPLAQKNKLDWESLVPGIVTGYEAAIRLAVAIQPSHRNQGYHATGTCGTIGVAVATAMALTFSQDRLLNTINAAMTSASGLLKVIKGGSELKPYNVGQAAVNGLISASIGGADFRGPSDILSGEWGVDSIWTQQFDREALFGRPDGHLWIQHVYNKPYAACRHSHSAIEAAINLRARNDLDTDKIESISVETYGLAVKGHEHTIIDSIASAKMSTPYSVAIALLKGRAGIEDYSASHIASTKLMNLVNKVTVSEKESLSEMAPEKRVASIEVKMKDGVIHSERVDLAKGEPENPLSDKELVAKFVSLAKYAEVSEKKIATILKTFEGSQVDLATLIGAIN